MPNEKEILLNKLMDACQSRMFCQNVKGSVKRTNTAIEFFTGAIQALIHTDQAELATSVMQWAVLILSTRGWDAAVAYMNEPAVEAAIEAAHAEA